MNISLSYIIINRYQDKQTTIINDYNNYHDSSSFLAQCRLSGGCLCPRSGHGLVWRHLQITSRDPPLLDLASVVIGGSYPPPPVLVDPDHLNLLPTGQLHSVVCGAWVIPRGGRVVAWGTWRLRGRGISIIVKYFFIIK